MLHGTKALLFFKEHFKVKPCTTECYVRTAMTPLCFCAPLSRRRPGGSAWRAACVKTTTRSGSCFISSMLWYSCCCSRKRSLKRHLRTILIQTFPRGDESAGSNFFDCKPVHGPFYINCFFFNTSEITRWIKPDGWIH